MSLISLLIAIAVERSLSSSVWGFHHYFQWYKKFFGKNIINEENTSIDKKDTKRVTLSSIVFIALPVVIIASLLSVIDNGLLHVALSTVILIICLGCTATRESYKHYLTSAFRGEETTTELHHQQLLSDKNLPPMGFGQALVWLNYRYYVAITLFFVVFGAAGAVFYRLLTSVIEQQNKACQEGIRADKGDDSSSEVELRADSVKESNVEVNIDNSLEGSVKEDKVVHSNTEDASFDNETNESAATEKLNEPHESIVTPRIENGCNNHHDILFWVDWLPVRITSFGYMFVGHFSKAMPVWLENCFDFHKPTHQVLIDVAERSEDILVDTNDCTSEPCLLVRLAKRNALLILAIIAVLTLTGVLT